MLKAKSFAGQDRFMVQAGDSHFLAKEADHPRGVMETSGKMKANELFLSMEVEGPKRFGIIEGGTRQGPPSNLVWSPSTGLENGLNRTILRLKK